MLTIKMLQMEEEESGSDSGLSSSPGSKNLMAEGGSSLFKTVLEDYVLDPSTRISKSEFERYKSRQQNKDKDSAEHNSSHRCENCQAVAAFCKCDMYSGSERKFGHRVHWADEVWNKPLKTIFGDENVECVNATFEHTCTHSFSENEPKPILKHKQTCIVIVSE